MHALVAVILPKGIKHREARTVIARTMEPFSQEGGQGMWDWYQVGGRFTGIFSGYNPNTDPANSETCDLCRGTGKRTDMEVQNGCNGCAGKGIRIVWPTDWQPHDGDIIKVRAMKKRTAFAVITPDGEWIERHGDDATWERELDKILDQHQDNLVAAVDYHT